MPSIGEAYRCYELSFPERKANSRVEASRFNPSRQDASEVTSCWLCIRLSALAASLALPAFPVHPTMVRYMNLRVQFIGLVMFVED